MSDVTIVIRYTAQPGRSERALETISALIREVVTQEPECSAIRILQNDGDPGSILLIEEWTDRETFDGPHMATPHIQEFIRVAGELFVGPPEISYWREA